MANPEDIEWARAFIADVEDAAESHGGNCGSFLYPRLAAKLNEIRREERARWIAAFQAAGLKGPSSYEPNVCVHGVEEIPFSSFCGECARTRT